MIDSFTLAGGEFAFLFFVFCFVIMNAPKKQGTVEDSRSCISSDYIQKKLNLF